MCFSELANQFRVDNSMAERYRDFFACAVVNHMLFPIQIRMATELCAQRSLCECEQFVPEWGIEWLEQSFKEADWEEMSSSVAQDKKQIHEVQRTRRRERDVQMSARFRPEDERIDFDQAIDNLDASVPLLFKEEWQFFIESACCDGLITNYSYFAYSIVRRALERFGEFGLDKGDAYDQIIYVDARSTGCDYLVTNDRKLA